MRFNIAVLIMNIAILLYLLFAFVLPSQAQHDFDVADPSDAALDYLVLYLLALPEFPAQVDAMTDHSDCMFNEVGPAEFDICVFSTGGEVGELLVVWLEGGDETGLVLLLKDGEVIREWGEVHLEDEILGIVPGLGAGAYEVFALVSGVSVSGDGFFEKQSVTFTIDQ